MSLDTETLYELLPAIYRVRDAEQGESLKELLAIIASQIAVLEENLDQLYDDLFIETAAEWAVPYIGDLIGTRGIQPRTEATFSLRAQVANTIAYRRRKGTAAVLEQLARDVTGWDANVVEFYQLLAANQYLNHLRLENTLPDLRQSITMERLNGPFDTLPHTVDVRRIASQRGKYNIPNVGLFLWRLRPYSITSAPAFRLDDRRYLFSPLGANMPLFNLPETEELISHLAEPENVPMPISRRLLDRELEQYYGPEKSLNLTVNGEEIGLDQVAVCNLADDNGAWAHAPSDRYGIDPVLGRITTPGGEPVPDSVVVACHYGFSAEMGAGEYDRVETFSGQSNVILVPSEEATIQDGLDALGASSGVVEIEDNGRYEETLTVSLVQGQNVEIRAADQHRPHLVLGGQWNIGGDEDSELIINGLLVSQQALRVAGDIQTLHLRHCTLVPGLALNQAGDPLQPGLPSLIVESDAVEVIVESSILGAMRVDEGAVVSLENSIVDANQMTNAAYAALDGDGAGGQLKAVNCTILGKVHSLLMEEITNCIIAAAVSLSDSWPVPVRAERQQAGCVRFTYLPYESQVPRRFHCQPENEENAGLVRPRFTSLRYSHPGYCQLRQDCPDEIWQGAEDEVEMGVFHDLFGAQREANLRVRLDEYLRFGLSAGVFYAS